MIVFIIPLKSPQASKSWYHVSKLFERCVKSVCNQTSPDFRVIVVCHEKPNIEFTHPHIKYVEVDFPLPGSEHRYKSRDQGRKVVTGLMLAREFQPEYTMIVDADDCISKYIAEFVKQHPDSNGWFMSKGYEYLDDSKRIFLKNKDFYKVCGTSNIIRYKLYDLPKSIDDELLPEYYIPLGHSRIRETLEKKGENIEPLPFVGAVYISTKTGENNSSQKSLWDKLRNRNPREILRPATKRLFQVLKSQPLTKPIIEEFGLYNIDLN